MFRAVIVTAKLSIGAAQLASMAIQCGVTLVKTRIEFAGLWTTARPITLGCARPVGGKCNGTDWHVLVLYCNGVEDDRYCLSDREDALETVQELRQEFPHHSFWLKEEYIRADDDPRGA
jgi:hypothetical protein